ncbi:CBS-domain-containing protein, partial [Neoconidiobolus thromboides FSU 785]
MSTNRPSSRHSNKNSTVSSKGDDNLSNARQRQTKRDEAIRRKAETDLKKKRNPNHSTSQRHSKRVPGTVSALRPSPALTVNSTIKVTEASQMMAAKRADCVLVVDEDEHLAGIFTAKDLAYRVVAEGLDARTTTVANIMTPNPLCVTSDASATDALNTMVQRGFRHLPVCNEEGDIVGLLDITKCLYDALDKMDRAYGSSRKLYDALEGVEKEWAMQAPQFLQLMGSLKDQINCPDVTTVLDGTLPADISPKTSVREAAKAMKAIRTTAVLVTENDSITGIFTSKDIVLRVIAAQLDPSNCSVVRVMTPHPDTALPDTTILDALKRMHNGHYLNLPIVDEFKQVVGMVDVLKLTYATLEQINNLQGQEGDGSGPMWSKFWSTALAGEDESTIS